MPNRNLNKLLKEEVDILKTGNRLQAISLFMRRTGLSLDKANAVLDQHIIDHKLAVPKAKDVNTGVDIHLDRDGHLAISVDCDHYNIMIEDQTKIINDIERLYKMITVKRNV